MVNPGEERRINVALVCTSINQLGGKNIHLKNLYRHINSSILKLYIVVCSSVERELKEYMIREGVNENDLILLPRFKKWLLLPFILEMRKIFQDKEIDIVHTFQIQSDVLGGVAARMSGITSLYSIFESKIIEDNISLMKSSFYKLVNSLIKHWFTKTIVVSEGLKRELIQGNFRPSDRIEVIHIGIDIPAVSAERKWAFGNLLQKRPLIGTIGRFSREKALGRFIKAMPLVLKGCSEAEFIIVGKGPEENKLKALAKELGLEKKLKFKPWTEDVFSVMGSIDIFVITSIREGCPHILLEALSTGRPVVASNIEGILDIIEDGKDGLLVDTANHYVLAQRILYLCDNLREAISLGQNGLSKIREQFNIKAEMQRYEELYTGKPY